MFPDFIYFKELVKEAVVDANLLVPSEKCAGTPASRSAGRLISPPPPAIESTKAATNPAAHNNNIVINIVTPANLVT